MSLSVRFPEQDERSKIGADLEPGAQGVFVVAPRSVALADGLDGNLTHGLEGARQQVVQHAEVTLDVLVIRGHAKI